MASSLMLAEFRPRFFSSDVAATAMSELITNVVATCKNARRCKLGWLCMAFSLVE
jgi:hypothetical protein